MKLKLPKIKFRLLPTLWVIFLAAVIIEGFILYKVLYLNAPIAQPAVPAVQSQKFIDLDLASFTKVYNWIQDKRAYQQPVYNLVGDKYGRPDPFAEY